MEYDPFRFSNNIVRYFRDERAAACYARKRGIVVDGRYSGHSRPKEWIIEAAYERIEMIHWIGIQGIDNVNFS